jgi:hypothetical protein
MGKIGCKEKRFIALKVYNSTITRSPALLTLMRSGFSNSFCTPSSFDHTNAFVFHRILLLQGKDVLPKDVAFLGNLFDLCSVWDLVDGWLLVNMRNEKVQHVASKR